MSDDTGAQAQDQQQGQETQQGQSQGTTTGGQSGKYTPPATQADLDRIIADRLSRERAKYADYDDLKAKAAKLDEIEQANLSEVEKAVKRAEEAEAKLAAYEKREQIAKWAAEIVKDSPIPPDALRGETKEELRQHFEQLVSLIPKEPPKKGALGPYVPDEGATPSGAVGTTGDWLRESLKR